MAGSIKIFLFFVAAIACVLALPAEESERVKKQVFYGGYGYGAYPYAASAYASSAYAATPLAYSATPLAYSAGYSAYPYAGFRSLYY